jgi:phosphate:Na+ symporter
MIGLFQVLGGLALFLLGVHMLSGSMEKLAGNRIQEWLDRMTNTTLKGAFFGAAATSLLQSSSLLMITLLGLVNAHLLTLEQAVGVMLGQEIGTTLTAQMVAFDIGDYCLLFIALGLALKELFPHRDWDKYGDIVMGFGILFLGMNLMTEALEGLAGTRLVEDGLVLLGQYPLAGVLIGTIVTAVVQSSSAVTGLVVAMGMSGTITLPGAIGVILGANIGTCIDTQLIAALRLARPAWRASAAQIFINVAGVLLFLPFIVPFANLVALTSTHLPRQIANAHTLFNVIVSIVMFPFVRYIVRLVEWLVPKSPEEEKPKLTAFIDEMLYAIPTVALTDARKELVRLGEVTAEMLDRSRVALVERNVEAAQWVVQQEQGFADPVTHLLEKFVNDLMRQELSESERRRCFQLKNLLVDIERVGDLAEDLAEAAQARLENGVPFSDQAQEELDRLCRYVHGIYTLALQALQAGDRDMAKRACEMEDKFDDLYEEARARHIQRLEEGVCHPGADVIFTETMRNLERVGDHADNIGVSVMRN